MRKALRYVLIILLVLLLFGAVAGYLLYHASQHVPDFYTEELKVAPATQEKDSDVMLQQATRLQTDLQRKGRWQQVIQAKTINAWLAVDLPRNHPLLLPNGMHDPRVHIGPDGITLASQVDRGGFHGVVSLEVSAFIESESADVIGLRFHAVRVGAIPWSIKPVLDSISNVARQHDLSMIWKSIDGDPVALIDLGPSGGSHKHVIHVDTIRLEEGQLVVAGTTETVK